MKNLVRYVLERRWRLMHDILNRAYNALPFNEFGWRARKWCHDAFADVVSPIDAPPEYWKIRVRFEHSMKVPMYRTILFPKENLREALTLLGYDIELKKFLTGAFSERTPSRRRVIIDGGFNRGTFSLLLLRGGKDNFIMYEPNDFAMEIGKRLFRLNTSGLTWADYRTKAIGAVKRREFVLYHPDKDWLGITGVSACDAIQRKQLSDPDCPHIDSDAWDLGRSVQCVTIDQDVPDVLPSFAILKLDLEGRELDALRGAVGMLTEYANAPGKSLDLFFESFKGSRYREGIFELLMSVDDTMVIYAIETDRYLSTVDEFIADTSSNFHVEFQ